MKKFYINCYDGEYDHYTQKVFDSKEEAEKVALLLCDLFGIEFEVEIKEINE